MSATNDNRFLDVLDFSSLQDKDKVVIRQIAERAVSKQAYDQYITIKETYTDVYKQD
jgi:hypothetical protein